MTIEILGLQGAVREHQRSLSRLGIERRVVKRTEELAGLSGMILPGRESMTLSLLACGTLLSELRRLARAGFPFFGTCAGMILSAKEVSS